MQDALAGANHYIIHTAQYESVMLMVEVYERGQIVIPKYAREMLKINPGANLQMTIEGRKLVFEQKDALEEMKAIGAGATMTDAELEKKTESLMKKRQKSWLNVP